MDRKKRRLLEKQSADTRKPEGRTQSSKELTPEEAVHLYHFKDACELDKFALQLDAMALMMHEKKIKDRPAMVDYIDRNFQGTTGKILAAIFVGSKLTENEWIEATVSEEARRNVK